VEALVLVAGVLVVVADRPFSLAVALLYFCKARNK
jgi:hypothetical protein